MKFLKCAFLASIFSFSVYSMEYEGPKKEQEEIKSSYEYLTPDAQEALEEALAQGVSLKQFPLDIRTFLYLRASEGTTIDQHIRDAILEAYDQNDGEAIKELLSEAKRTKSNIAGHDFDTNDLIFDALRDGKYTVARALIEIGPIDPFDYQPTKYYYAVVNNPTIPQPIKNDFIELIKKSSIYKK